MQAVAVLLAGMILVGSVLLHRKRFSWCAVVKGGKVAGFVYISLIAGLFLADFAGVMNFQTALIRTWVYDPARQGSLYDMRGLIPLYFFAASAIMVPVSIAQFRGYQSEWLMTFMTMVMGVMSIGIITQGVFPTFILEWLLTSTGGKIITFCLLVLAVGALNTVFGIIFVGLNFGLLVIQLAKGQAINLFSLLGLLELADVDGVLVAFSIMALTTAIGALEFAIQHFDFGAGHL